MISVPSGASRRRRPSAAPMPIQQASSDVLQRACISTRGILLLVMALVAFEAFAVCVLLELARLDPTVGAAAWLPRHVAAALRAVDAELFAACMGVLLLAVPVTCAAAWMPASIVAQVTPSPAPSVATVSDTTITKATKLSTATAPHRDPYFRIFQLVAWTLYAASFSGWLRGSVASLGTSLDTRATLAVLALLAESLVVSSILARDRHLAASSSLPAALPAARRTRLVVLVHNVNNMLLVLGALLLAASAEAAWQSDAVTPTHAHSLGRHALSAGVNSAALVVTAVFTTYGLGGVLAPKAGWKFFQPFAGGAQFMLCQAVSWTCFAVGLFLQLLFVLSLVIVELELFVGALALAGSLFLVSEVVMVASLLVFQGTHGTSTRMLDTNGQPTARLHPLQALQARVRAFAEHCLGAFFVGIMANTQWLPTAVFVVVYAVTTHLPLVHVLSYALLTTLVEFVFVAARSIAIHLYNQDSRYGARSDVSEYRLKYVLPQLLALALPLVATHGHYVRGHDAALPMALLSGAFYLYVASYGGQPQLTGARTRRAWVTQRSVIMETVVTYFQGRILRDAALDPTQHYIMGFHPHGIMSTSVLWLQFSQQWRDLFPGVHASILTASVLHQIPLARDILQFFGGREVTRQSFARALTQKETVLLVPGGQAEMLEQRSGQKQVRVYTHHKGFLRLAIEHGTPLVPVLSFQEGETMDNIQAPQLQRWFIKTVAFPLPFFPYGRFGLPVPRPTPIVIAVGAPLYVAQKAAPTAADVDAVHAQYFARLRGLFDKYKDEAGCSDFELVLI